MKILTDWQYLLAAFAFQTRNSKQIIFNSSVYRSYAWGMIHLQIIFKTQVVSLPGEPYVTESLSEYVHFIFIFFVIYHTVWNNLVQVTNRTLGQKDLTSSNFHAQLHPFASILDKCFRSMRFSPYSVTL